MSSLPAPWPWDVWNVVRFGTDSLSRDVPWTAGTQKVHTENKGRMKPGSQFRNCSELYQVWWIWWSASIPGILASIYNLQGERKQVCFPPQKLQRSSRHQAISCHQITHCNQALHLPTSLDHFHPAACAPASHAWDHRHSFGICPKAQINGPTRRGCWIVQRVFLMPQCLQTSSNWRWELNKHAKSLSWSAVMGQQRPESTLTSHTIHFTRGQNNVLPWSPVCASCLGFSSESMLARCSIVLS